MGPERAGPGKIVALTNLHWEATPPGVRKAYEALPSFLAEEGFYLAGGTALALLEAHRLSADLDLFAPSIGDPLVLAGRLKSIAGEITILSTAPETLYISIGGIRVSFIGSSYGLLAPLLQPEGNRVPLASLDDIAAMKLAAVASRGSRKDFVDLWVLVTRHRSLEEYLALYEKKYRADTGHVLRSLIFFDDSEREPLLRLLADISWNRVKADLESWVDVILRGEGEQ